MIGRCAWCGSEFEALTVGGHEKRFCRDECRIASWATRKVGAVTGRPSQGVESNHAVVTTGVEDSGEGLGVLGVVVQDPATGRLRTVRHG